jgi:hypothetical protein
MDGGSEKTGGLVMYNHNVHDNYPKDETVTKYMPDEISECALHLGKKPGEPCASDETVNKIGKIIRVEGTPSKIMTEAVKKLQCGRGTDGEICVLKKLERDLGPQRVRAEIEFNHKVIGPTDSKLLSNVNLDSQMQQWMSNFKDFFAYNFNMRNYADYKFRHGRVIGAPDTLATIQFDNIVRGSWTGGIDEVPYMEKFVDESRKGGANGIFKCAGCIINKDVYQGEGTHWMALFADVRGSRYTVEFFNSSGNSPDPEWVNWMVKTQSGIERMVSEGVLPKPPDGIELLKVSNIRHQKSKSECGLYALFYIWLRLNDVPPEYFATTPVPDQHMFEFRQHLFHDPNGRQIKRFLWDAYQKRVNIQWE